MVLAAVVLSVVGLVVVPASPAAAANTALASVAPVTGAVMSPNGRADCPGGWLCFWVHTYYQGPMGKLAGDNANWSIFSQSQCELTRNWSDCASSTFNNRTDCAVYLYKKTFYDGHYLWEQPGSFRDNLTLNFDPGGQSFNDTISSNDWCL